MGYWGIDWPEWASGGRSDYSGAQHQATINAIAQVRASQGSSASSITIGSGNDVQWGNRQVVIDLQSGVASIYVTKYVPKYTTKVVSRYMTRVKRIITALTVNYMLNGQVVTQVVIPTRIVLKESGGMSMQRGRRVRTVPKNMPVKIIV